MQHHKNFAGGSFYTPAANLMGENIFIPKPNGISPFAPCVDNDVWAKGFASFIGSEKESGYSANFTGFSLAQGDGFNNGKLPPVYMPVKPTEPVTMNAYDYGFPKTVPVNTSQPDVALSVAVPQENKTASSNWLPLLIGLGVIGALLYSKN